MADCNDDTYDVDGPIGGYRAEDLLGRRVWFTGPSIDLEGVVVGSCGLDLGNGFAGTVDLLLGEGLFETVCTFPLAHCAITRIYGSPELVEGR